MLLSLLLPLALAQAGQISVQVDKPIHKVSPTFYGLMTEEINHSYDGGLYAELIRNRSFRDSPKAPAYWDAVNDTKLALEDYDGKPSMQVTVNGDGDGGAANVGFWGMAVSPNTTYYGAVIARGEGGFHGTLTVSLQSVETLQPWACATIGPLTSNEMEYRFSLRTGGSKPSTDNRFVISAQESGTFVIRYASLFPPTYHSRPNGSRPDLMQLLQGLKPSFLRLPGGNYLEGDTVPSRFEWKSTLSPPEDREGHQGPWGYRSSDGMGLLEFLEWCQDLNMQPVLAVYAGYSLNHQHVEPGSALLPFVQDALDEIQFVTGSTRTKWGAVRANLGHPKPFPLTYVEIGNEDWFDGSHSYGARFAQFYDAIKAKYPRLRIIATAQVSSRTPDVLDDHYYRSAADMEKDSGHYDHTDRRGPKIFVGEWASTEGSPTPNLNAALGDAAWLIGLERDSDIVIMEAYAPLLVNVSEGGAQWGTNLIGFDAGHSFGSPSYWVQSLFAHNTGDETLPIFLSADGLYADATEDSKTGVVYLKVSNPTAGAVTATIDLDGARDKHEDKGWIISGRPEDQNTVQEPRKVAPKPIPLDEKDNHVFPAFSVTVIRFKTR